MYINIIACKVNYYINIIARYVCIWVGFLNPRPKSDGSESLTDWVMLLVASIVID